MAEVANSASRPSRVAVVGAGWAGCAAAVALAHAGVSVTLFEQAKTLGGRARRVIHHGHAVDNGEHLLVGAYRQTLDLIELVHGKDSVPALFHRLPLIIHPFGTSPSNGIRLKAWRAPAPWHLAGALLGAHGLDWNERVALIRSFRRLQRGNFRRPVEETVAQCFADIPRRAFAQLWEPLSLAALNTPSREASAQVFADVLQAAFTGRAANADFLIPRVDLSACFPDAAARYIQHHDGMVREGLRVHAIEHDDSAVTVDLGDTTESFSAAIVAVGPHQLAATLGPNALNDESWRAPIGRVEAFEYQSITTIYLGLARPIVFEVPLLRLDDAPGHWVFDRSGVLLSSHASGAEGLIAVVISGGGPHDHLDHGTLAREIEAQLRRLAPSLPAVAWSQVIAERRATYACKPALARPTNSRIAPRLYLAGDYTDPIFPATLEAATRSGVAAARALIGDRGQLFS